MDLLGGGDDPAGALHPQDDRLDSVVAPEVSEGLNRGPGVGDESPQVDHTDPVPHRKSAFPAPQRNHEQGEQKSRSQGREEPHRQ